MKFLSTRDGSSVSLDDALMAGIAADGGLFMPEHLPRFSVDDFSNDEDIRALAIRYLRPYFEGSELAGDLGAIVGETFSFPIPLSTLPVDTGSVAFLELFHGPTAAFKDIGAGFLAACISRLGMRDSNPRDQASKALTILVATSGDTGGAVAAAFDDRAGIRVVVLYPDGRVSARQAHQLTCWSDNVLSLAVQGTFDDCQSLVKAAMADKVLSERHCFTSANSINIGRLLPQSIYFANTSLRHFEATGNKPSFIVPTGNLGNGFACVMARAAGLPIGEIVLATNANTLIGDYLRGAEWAPRVSVQTLATAMDVGNPSNMERLRKMFGNADALNKVVRVHSVADNDIEQEIRSIHRDHGIAICPHTATAAFAYRQLSVEERTEQDWILAATAHPAKFESIVEPLIGEQVPLPAGLSEIMAKPSRFSRIAPDLTSLIRELDARIETSDK